jgi:hypothetical protein
MEVARIIYRGGYKQYLIDYIWYMSDQFQFKFMILNKQYLLKHCFIYI